MAYSECLHFEGQRYSAGDWPPALTWEAPAQYCPYWDRLGLGYIYRKVYPVSLLFTVLLNVP